jgi:hypothetical protein
MDDGGDEIVVIVDEDFDSVARGRVESGRQITPRLFARKWKSPNARSMPSWRASKAELRAGECGVKQREPKWIDSLQIGESWTAEIGTAGVVIPTQNLPTDGANCHGVTTAIPLVEDIRAFREGGRRCVLVIPAANKEKGHKIYPGSGPSWR